jgi:tetratricopeptide (TPR) repeat protein
MNKLSTLLAAACLIGSVSIAQPTSTFAQQTQPAAAAQDKPDPATERKAYDALQACSKETDCNKKIAMAKEMLGLYPKSTYVPYMKEQITQARGCLFQEALQKENWPQAFTVGDELLVELPENLNLLLSLSDVCSRLAKKNDYSYADKGTQYSKKSIELIDKGVVPNGVKPEDWAAKLKSQYLGSLHQGLGLYALKAKKEDEAFELFKKSAEQDCTDPITYYLIAQIHSTKYDTFSAEYQALDAEKKTGDEGKAVLEKINGVVDQMLESYGKMLAVADGKANFDGLRSKVKPVMEDLFKYRHEGKADGMQAYIDGLKPACAAK